MQAQTLDGDGSRCRSLSVVSDEGTTSIDSGGQDRPCRFPLVIVIGTTTATVRTQVINLACRPDMDVQWHRLGLDGDGDGDGDSHDSSKSARTGVGVSTAVPTRPLGPTGRERPPPPSRLKFRRRVIVSGLRILKSYRDFLASETNF